MNKYKTLVIVGAQWGDEGKGKIIDYIAQKADMVVRFNGGNNAGHTVVVNGKTFKFRLLPSGIISESTVNVIANGVVINLNALLEEIKEVEKLGVKINKLYLSSQATLILPYHIEMDKFIEEKRGSKKIGTTARGIGPAYTDKVSREAIFLGDILDKNVFAEKLRDIYSLKKQILSSEFPFPPLEEVLSSQFSTFEEISKRNISVTDTSLLINQYIDNGYKVLFEGAQGTLLDVNFGTYPYVTSSNTISGSVCVGAGVSPTKINKIIGVVKAYTSRVGEGPFPSEIFGELADYIREKGREFGTVTRRPRRIGWLDIPALKYANRINSFTDIALTKIDVLTGLKEIKIAKEYKYKGKIITEFPTTMHELSACEPVLETLPGWNDSFSKIKSREEISQNAENYIKYIENELKVPVTIIGTGEERDQIIITRDPWEM
ncbi:MAG: adenylosuccinate synthase [Dictyoglomus sp. NZ13-RE01]|nr:MAG: adenylosuccinate synthase [Dictyoglomus sp. NZ13-RE01]